MNSYEQRRQAKKERYEELAGKARSKSENLAEQSRKMYEAIPFGQPILCGHHSEKSDRSYRNKAWNKIGQSVAEMEKAEYYERRAEGISNSISSDDPDAIKKLVQKLEELEKRQAMMKAVNKAINSKKLSEIEKIEVIMKEVGCEEKEATEFLNTPDCFGNYGFARYQLSNNNANIRAVKQRIEILKRRSEIEGREDVKGDGWILKENKELNRIMFVFDGKPEEQTRNMLKAHGFRWSPMNKAWQRMLNENGRRVAKTVIELYLRG